MTITLEQINNIEQLVSNINIDKSALSDYDLIVYRKALLRIGNSVKSVVKTTAVKEHTATDEAVMSHVFDMLSAGFNLIPSSLTLFTNSQHTTKWKHIIKHCVKKSMFGISRFKIKHLRYQRNNIERATTLHDLRQSINAIIGPLSLYRQQAIREQVMYDTDYNDMLLECINVDSLIIENNRLSLLLSERGRVIDEMMSLYNEPMETLTGDYMVTAIDQFKALHSATDEQACKVLGVHKRALYRQRKAILERESDRDKPLEITSV